MHLKRLIPASLVALALPLSASAGSLVIPAAGTGPGANGSHWKREVTIANLSADPVDVSLIFHDATGAGAPAAFTIPAHATVGEDDVVATRFGLASATGAIEIATADPSKLAVISRTYNESATGRFGQDIPAVDLSTLTDTRELVLLGPANVVNQRFNFGIYAASDATVEWVLHRADGGTAATVEQTYTAGQQIQYNGGVQALFSADAKNFDSVDVVFKSGTGIVYGSAIENESGDPSFVGGIVARRIPNIQLLGVDRNEDGIIEYPDANHDGVTDQPLDLATSLFPNFFRVVASAPNGEKVSFQILDNVPDVMLVDDNGTIEWVPFGDRKGTTGTLRIKATAGTESAIFTIKVNFL
jgi:hypothetical protein